MRQGLPRFRSSFALTALLGIAAAACVSPELEESEQGSEDALRRIDVDGVGASPDLATGGTIDPGAVSPLGDGVFAADPGISSSSPQINWSLFAAPPPSDADSLRARDILLNANEYSLTHWYVVRGYEAQSGSILDLAAPSEHDSHGVPVGANGEHRVRSAAGVAMSLAVSLELGIYDASKTNVTRARAQERALKLIRSVAYHHRTNDSYGPSRWGRSWQSPLWALYAGTAAWLMWDQLTATEQGYVRNMVEDEARRLVGYDVEYFYDENDVAVKRCGSSILGVCTDDNQSAAEENAWNAQFLFLAVNMFPAHAMRAAWEYKAAELAVGAYARPWDRRYSTAPFGGRPWRDWLRGSNVRNDGAVINHGMNHPDYMVTVAYSASAPLWYGLRRRATPDTMFAGAPEVYRTLVDTTFKDGTIYIPSSSTIYYPDGTDWGRERRLNFLMMDVVARHFGLDGLATTKAPVWEELHARRAWDMQQYSSNGRTYTSDSQDTYASREEWVAVHAAMTYMTKWIAAQGAYARTTAFMPVVIDNQDRDFNLTGPWNEDQPFDRLGDRNVYHEGGGASGSRRAQWKPRKPLPAGTYRVSAWWSAFPNHATDVPYTIFHKYGSTVVKKNQRTYGGRWNTLGTFDFDGTTNGGYVEMWNRTSTGYLVADGVMFEKL